MRIKIKDIGEHRWMCHCIPESRSESSTFRKWIKENLSDTKIASYRAFTGGTSTPHVFELRGRDFSARTLLLMVWGNNKI